MPDIKFPWPINVQIEGNVNGDSFVGNGSGTLRSNGVYQAVLNFSSIPKQFHPSAIGALTVSNCCGAGASVRNGALNMSTMGVEHYNVHRTLDFGKSGRLDMVGTAAYRLEALVLNISIKGEVSLPDDLSGHSIYLKKVYPEGDGRLLGTGQGSLFRTSGSDVPFRIDTKYDVRPSPLPRPMKSPQFRIATESGQLFGLSYHLTIHSIFDGENTLAAVDSQTYAG